MIHIVFQQADVPALQKSFTLDETLKGEVVEIKDDYAVGPLKDIYSATGIEARRQWWRDVLKGGDGDSDVETGEVDDKRRVDELVDTLHKNPEETAWLWLAANKHDVSGYYWLITQLKDFSERICVLHLHNLPFINEKGHLFYPTNIFEIPAREFLKAKKLKKVVTAAEFEIDGAEWARLLTEDKGVRTLESGKKLTQHDYDYYDDELMKFITADWQKVNKLFHAFFSKSKSTTGDAYLLWRLKFMIAGGKINAQGEIRGMKEFEVKLKVNG